MSYDEYRRLHVACLDMAKQASVPEMRARWRAMAESWLRRATELGAGGAEGRAAVAPRLHRPVLIATQGFS
jgi:hypothetical protein